MKLYTGGEGLYVMVRASHIVSISNYQRNKSCAPMKGMSEVKLINGDTILCDGNAETVYAQMQLELPLRDK